MSKMIRQGDWRMLSLGCQPQTHESADLFHVPVSKLLREETLQGVPVGVQSRMWRTAELDVVISGGKLAGAGNITCGESSV